MANVLKNLQEDVRNLVSLREIKEVIELDGADNIIGIAIDGWKCVINKFPYPTIGDKGVYFEIDTFIPVEGKEECFNFLSQSFKTLLGIKGIKIKSKKFNKFNFISQGLFLPLSHFSEQEQKEILESNDLDKYFNVSNYTQTYPDHCDMLKKMSDHYPTSSIQRIQNVFEERILPNLEKNVEITVKLNGQTAGFKFLKTPEKFREIPNTEEGWFYGINSNSVDLKPDSKGTLVNTVLQYDLIKKFKNPEIWNYLGCKNIYLTFELIGKGIPRKGLNPEKINNYDIYGFKIYDLDNNIELLNNEFIFNYLGISKVPILYRGVLKDFATSLDEFLQKADGTNLINGSEREGYVIFFPHTGKRVKVISNEYLLKYGS